MINYTANDLVILNQMVGEDFEGYVINLGRSVCIHDSEFNKLTKDCLFKVEDILNEVYTAEQIIDRILVFWSDMVGISNILSNTLLRANKLAWKKLFLEVHLNEMPRYLNSTNQSHVIAKWRLKIGK
jgi:hypothetical protein